MSEAFLVLRHGGVTWAVARPAVQGLARRGAGFAVEVAAGTLVADEVLGVTPDLRTHAAGGVLRRFWPEAVRGLAIYEARPVVLIDPLAPPRSLLAAPPAGPSGPAGPAGTAHDGGTQEGDVGNGD